MIRRLLIATFGLCVVVATAVFAFSRMPLLAPIGPEAATRALAIVRASLSGAPPPALAAEADAPQRRLPVIVTLYDRARLLARGVGHGDTFGAALGEATRKLRDAVIKNEISSEVIARARLKLDRVVGRGFLSSRVLPLLAIGAVPGRDGVGVDDGDAQLVLTNDDLVRERLWSGYRPLPGVELAIGIDANRLFRAIALHLDRPPRWQPRRLYRFRSEEYLETASGATPVVADHVPGPPVTRGSLAAGARAGGAYLLHHLDAAGRFDYEYYLVEDASVHAGYSFPRHAGAASFLAQLYALDHDQEIRAGAELALDTLAKMHPRGCDGARACVGELDDPIVDLGGAALALVAVSEYARTTGDARYAPFARRLAEFVLFMQKENGDFCHVYTPATGVRDEKKQLLYYSGEAAYALGRMLALGRDDAVYAARAAAALDRALRYLTHDAYDTFAGQFYVGEDHWTCMALDAGWDFLPSAHREEYARFCDAFSSFLRRSQFRSGESLVDAQPQIEGAYGLTALLAPHTTPVGSRSETTISMWRIAKKRGLSADDRRVSEPREQVLDGMRFLLARQLRASSAYLAADENAAAGGIPESDVDAFVRIDFVQHACSAMLRALEML